FPRSATPPFHHSITPFPFFSFRTRAANDMVSAMGITPQQFKQMQQRLGGSRRAPMPVFDRTPAVFTRPHQVILGLDPSLRGTGYGVIRLANPCPRTLAHGTISCPAGWEHSKCLVKIVRSLREVLKQ